MKIERNQNEINLARPLKNEAKNEIPKLEMIDVEANSSEALNSYGRAMVNLAKPNEIAPLNSSWDFSYEPMSQEEKEEIEEELLELFQGDKKALDEFLGENEAIKEKKLEIVKAFKDNSSNALQAQYFLNGASQETLDDETYLNYLSLLQEILLNDDYFNKEGYEDITKYIDKSDNKTANRQINFLRAMLQKGFRKDYLVRTFDDVKNANENSLKNTTSFLESLPDSLMKNYLITMLSQILLDSDEQTNETLVEAFKPVVLELSEKGKFQEISPLVDFKLFLEKPENAQFLKEILSYQMEPKEARDILFFSESSNDDVAKSQRAFAFELLDESFSPSDVGKILSSTCSSDVDVNSNQISFAKELLDSKMEPDELSLVLSKTRTKEKETNERNIELAKAFLANGANAGAIGVLLYELDTPNPPIKKYFIETMEQCGLNRFQMRNIIKAISPMVDFRN